MQSYIDNPEVRKNLKKFRWKLLLFHLIVYPAMAWLFTYGNLEKNVTPVLVILGIGFTLSVYMSVLNPLVEIYWWEHKNKKTKTEENVTKTK